MILGPHVSSTGFLTVIAMIAFAANSLLCRMALGAGLIDASSFATIRVVAGAVILMLLALPRRRIRGREKADVIAVATLFLYMAFFSFAYLSLAAGTGALILFGAVQLTMFTAALHGGERFSPASWLGLTVALAELVYLVSPGAYGTGPARCPAHERRRHRMGRLLTARPANRRRIGIYSDQFSLLCPAGRHGQSFCVTGCPGVTGRRRSGDRFERRGIGPRLRCLVRCAPRPNGQPRRAPYNCRYRLSQRSAASCCWRKTSPCAY
jgi:hypothetical protein